MRVDKDVVFRYDGYCILGRFRQRRTSLRLERIYIKNHIMFSVYVLKSEKNGKRYVGYTSKNPEVRLHEHNTGSNKFTGRNCPFVLIYTEQYLEKTEAMKREKFLKSGQGRRFLDTI